MLRPGLIIPFDGNHANIPSGFSRDTRFDDLYVKATLSGWGTTGGNTTHIHISPSHTHTYTNNSHTHTTGTIANASPVHKTDAQHQDSPPQDVAPTNHYHDGVTSGAMTNASCTSVGATVGTAENKYSRYNFIFIKSDGYNFIPNGGIIMRDDITARADATHFDSSDSRYLKGASAGADAGGAVDVTTHDHTQTHLHTLTHNHSSASTTNTIGLLGGLTDPSSSMGDHGHTITFENHSENVSNSTDVPSHSVDLAYQELHLWKFSSNKLPKKGDIAILIDGDVPIGWDDMLLEDVYVKGKTSGQAVTTGGSLTHNHTSITHSHTGSTHVHTWNASTVGGSNSYKSGGTTSLVGNHTHSGTTSSTANASVGSSDITFDSSNHEPEYIKVRFIKANDAVIMGGAALGMIL